MRNLLKSIWMDIAFFLSIIFVLISGMYGYESFFPVVMALAALYLILMVVRIFMKKES
jgi:hypothetical protein